MAKVQPRGAVRIYGPSPTAPSYLILHELRGCGAAPSSWLVIRCWHHNDLQEELFRGSRGDAGAFLASHWDDQP